MNDLPTTATTITPPATLPAASTATAATAAASALLAHLAPLFPVVAAAAKTQAGAAAWLKSWSVQIQISGLRPWQIERGLTRLGEHDPDIPFSWASFYRLCVDRLRDADDASHRDDDPVYAADRERRLREFQARYPGARLHNC